MNSEPRHFNRNIVVLKMHQPIAQLLQIGKTSSNYRTLINLSFENKLRPLIDLSAQSKASVLEIIHQFIVDMCESFIISYPSEVHV